jgi:hypothetical protein
VELIWTRAASLVRRGWRATIVIALLAGLAAGVAMAMVGAGRRTASSYERFAEFADVPELLINFCPPGLIPDDEDELAQCLSYDPKAERDTLVQLPEVEAAARGSFRGVTMAPADAPEELTLASSLAMYDEGISGVSGRYRVLHGSDAATADEIVISEQLAEQGFAVGDDVVLTFWGTDELGTFVEDAVFHGPTAQVRIAGIVRALTDVTASEVGFGANDDFLVYTGPGLAEATDEAEGFFGVLVEATDDDAEAATAAIHAAFPGRPFNLVPALGDDEIAPSRDSIRYEAQALSALGAVVGLVVALFVAQLVARQSRREWDDGPVLRAIGVTRGSAIACALARSLAISLPAIVVAAVTAVALSPLGPVGLARKAEVDPGVDVDLLVLGLGSLALFAVVTLAGAAPVLRGRVLRPPAQATLRPVTPRSVPLPPVLSAGVHLARRGRSGALVQESTALIGVAAAIAVGIAAVSLAASFDDLVNTPERFGATWDLSMSGSSLTDDATQPASAEGVRDQIAAAAAITGTDFDVDGETAWIHAFAPIDGVDDVVPLPINEGRAPATDEEIALGEITLRKIGKSIGDSVTVTSPATGEHELKVVGVAIINDTFEASPGRGGAVTPELMAIMAPEASGDPVVLELKPGADVDDVTRRLGAIYDGPVQPPVEQVALLNVGRVRYVPFVMAGVVALLAIASLVHALVLSVGRNRRPLGVLKSLGFTRVQVGGTVACQANAFGLVALVTAVPLGVFLGRQVWALVAEQLGVPDVPQVPVAPAAAVVLLALAVVNVVASYPAWRAARLPTATALRSE